MAVEQRTPPNGEHLGARHRIAGVTRPGPQRAEESVTRSVGVITSIPVSTNWQAIQNAFVARGAMAKIRHTDDSQGGMD
jgi:hypothetical protein